MSDLLAPTPIEMSILVANVQFDFHKLSYLRILLVFESTGEFLHRDDVCAVRLTRLLTVNL